ncbi:MAG: hypothetical protein H0W74_03770 [Sphingosinicella sp.]|nr:hypothetical protein [Sphingosinicella sp.]
MPVKPPPPLPKPPVPTPNMVAAKIYMGQHNATRLSFVISNTGSGPSQTQIVVDGYDTFFKRWMPHWAETIIPLQPNESYNFDQPTSDKACWRIRSAHMTASGNWQIGNTWNYPGSCPHGPAP